MYVCMFVRTYVRTYVCMYLLDVYRYVGLFRFVRKLLLVLNLLEDLSWSLCKGFVLTSRRFSVRF